LRGRIGELLVFGVLVGFGALLLFVVVSGREFAGLSHGLTLGIFGSLVATAYVAGLGYQFGWPVGRRARLKGVRRVEEKSALERSDWFKLLSEAKAEFYLAGHSMGLWCAASNREEFVAELRRIVRGGGTVTLVMLELQSEPLRRLERASGVNYNDRVSESLEVLGALAPTLGPDERQRLQVRVLRDHLSTPYMVVGNERRLITASYMAMSKNDASICIELDRANRYATAIYNDFHKLAREGASLPTGAGAGRTAKAVAPSGPERAEAATPDGQSERPRRAPRRFWWRRGSTS
jgi:predicted alpha/beta hydrolase family esterase